MNLRDELQATIGGSYTLEQELGGGGMSRVFLAADQALGRRVVIKVLAPELAAGVNRERFQREVLLSAQLQHPNIVPVLNAGSLGELPYFVMPFVEGQSLRAALAERGALPVGEVVAILRDVARALEYAHGRGVVHRDIKPDNVLLSSGAAMVTDFGVAKAVADGNRPGGPGSPLSPSGNPRLTGLGTSLGTLSYMAPEQAAADPDVDHRADLYSLGAMAYELLAGKAPFAGLPPRQLLTAIVAQDPPGLETLRADLPPGLADLVRRCLRKAPEDRPQTATEILAALEGAGAAAPRPQLRHLVPVAGVALVLALTGLWWFRDRSGGHEVPPNSLAVLPFARVGGTADDDYFSDGITDELTTTLSRVPTLRVASSSSAFAFRDRRGQDVRAIARRLGVAQVLEGSVRREGDRVRVSVQLTSASDGLARWAERYDREVKDVFAVQDEIARAIAAELQLAMGPDRNAATADLEAYDLYLRGRFYWRQRGEESLRTAASYFSQAIARDSGFARAWAGLADALGLLPLYSGVPVDSVLAIAEPAAQRAIVLDGSLAEAHAALGQLYRSVGRWQESGAALDRAVRSDSNNASAWQWRAELSAVLGNPAVAVGAMRRAASLEPMSPTITGELGYLLAMDGQWDSAFAVGRRAVQLAPELWTVHAFLGSAYLWHHQGAEAAVELERAMSLAPGNPFAGALAYAYAISGREQRARALADSLDQEAAAGRGSPASVAVAWVGLDQPDRALQWLERAVEVRDGFLYASSLYVPWFAPLRSHPGFSRIVRRMGVERGS